GGEALDLIAGPIVGIAEGVGQRLEIGTVKHHRLLAVEVKDRLTFLVRALPNRLHLDMRDDGDDRLALYDGSLKVAAWKCIGSFYGLVLLHVEVDVRVRNQGCGSVGGASSCFRTTIGVGGTPKRGTTVSVPCGVDLVSQPRC